MPRCCWLLNAYHDVVPFCLPKVAGGRRWRRLLDTNIPDSEGAFAMKSGEEYLVTARSVALFALEADHRPSVALRRAHQALRQVAETPAIVPSA